MSSPPFTGEIPALLEDLTAVVAGVVDTKGRLVEANRGFRRIVERYGDASPDDVRALFYQPSFSDLLDEGTSDGWTQIHEGLLNVGEASGLGALSIEGSVHRNDDRLVILAEFNPSHQEKLRERMTELNDELTAAQREMTRELKARERAEEALAAKARDLERSNQLLQEFAYVVSHDLQEPLRMVRSYLQLLEKRYEDRLDEEAHEFIEYAVDGATRMREMIEGLLEYSRVESRGQEPESVDAGRVLADVLDSLHLQIEEAGAQVETEALGTVLADEGQLGHLFQNLVANALHYAGDEPRIRVGTEDGPEGFQRIYVADDGPGIPEDQRDDVFRIFQRGADAPGDGTGIGLAVCERIVDRHDGEIGVEAADTGGAKFWFTLPKKKADAEGSSATDGGKETN